MPHWLCNQLLKAYHKKDLRQIRYLNDCWFFYRTKGMDREDAALIYSRNS
ncbi:MAG TPA: cortex morphogenetic protein CmpA [Bacilli bacterium]